MNLLDACEPLFQSVCRLNRSARKGVAPTAQAARAELKAVLHDARTRAGPTGADQFAKVELPLMYFIDGMVRSSTLPFAKAWPDLAAERGKSGGDEEFFDLLDETLRDPSDPAAQRLAVFATCLGLGFTGWYAGQPEFLRKKSAEIASRLRGLADTDPAARVCPDAYESTNTADLIKPPSRTIVALGIVIIGLGVTVFAANAALFLRSRAELKSVLTSIIQSDTQPSAPATTPAPEAAK